jgi:hypothetical protein
MLVMLVVLVGHDIDSGLIENSSGYSGLQRREGGVLCPHMYFTEGYELRP